MNMIASSLVKSEEWSYEQEWRLTIFKQSDEFPSKIKVPMPIGIYLGTRFQEHYWISRNKIKLQLNKW
jgi:hypothetical protein